MAPVGVAIIGSGLFVKAEHLPAVLRCDLLSLRAIFSRSLKSAQDTAAQLAASPPDLYAADAGAGKTYHDLLLRDDISAVIVALPIVAQPEFVEAALAAGKHVLAEKPIAQDVASAQKLIAYYRRVSAGNGATLAIAENVRFFPSFAFAAEQVARLGRVTHFSVRVMSLTKEDNKYYQTEWRKKPEFQGGFLLDGGVHYAAATRLLLAGDNAPASVRAFTAQAQAHLPPIDTINAIIKTRSGGAGTFQHSVGTTSAAFEWDIACQEGSVKVVGDTITVKPRHGEQTVKEYSRSSGVTDEVAAWAKGIADGKPNPLQSPELALGDLEFMEKIFKSGEGDGETHLYELQ